VLLQVGTASVEPTDGQLYDPTDGATTDSTEVVDLGTDGATTDPTEVVDLGTAMPDGGVPPWFGRAMTCRCERCAVAASADVHRTISRPMAKTARIGVAPIELLCRV
jgi:hypothetical protein